VALTPAPLRKGDVLAAVSPAGPVGADEVSRGADALGMAGYKLLRLPHALRQGQYLAGSDDQRASDLMDAFLDDRYQGIICTRGGYGSMRLLELLDFQAISHHPKPFVGFSDISALQAALWQQCELVTFSGPQLARGFGKAERTEDGEGYSGLDPFSSEHWFTMLEGRGWGEKLPMPEGSEGLMPVAPGRAEGTLLGGNLAVLAGLCGTPWSPRFNEAVALLEEIDEPPYRIDRMLTQLRLAGAFEGVKGIVLGEFVQHAGDEVKNWSQLAGEMLTAMLPEVPIVRGAPYGHVGPCWTLPVGGWALLDANQGSLRVERGR